MKARREGHNIELGTKSRRWLARNTRSESLWEKAETCRSADTEMDTKTGTYHTGCLLQADTGTDIDPFQRHRDRILPEYSVAVHPQSIHPKEAALRHYTSRSGSQISCLLIDRVQFSPCSTRCPEFFTSSQQENTSASHSVKICFPSFSQQAADKPLHKIE